MSEENLKKSHNNLMAILALGCVASLITAVSVLLPFKSKTTQFKIECLDVSKNDNIDWDKGRIITRYDTVSTITIEEKDIHFRVGEIIERDNVGYLTTKICTIIEKY